MCVQLAAAGAAGATQKSLSFRTDSKRGGVQEQSKLSLNFLRHSFSFLLFFVCLALSLALLLVVQNS